MTLTKRIVLSLTKYFAIFISLLVYFIILDKTNVINLISKSNLLTLNFALITIFFTFISLFKFIFGDIPIRKFNKDEKLWTIKNIEYLIISIIYFTFIIIEITIAKLI